MRNIHQKIGLIGGVSGAIMVTFNYTLLPNCIWFVSNLVMFQYFLSVKEKELALQSGIFFLIAIWGIINLGFLQGGK